MLAKTITNTKIIQKQLITDNIKDFNSKSKDQNEITKPKQIPPNWSQTSPKLIKLIKRNDQTSLLRQPVDQKNQPVNRPTGQPVDQHHQANRSSSLVNRLIRILKSWFPSLSKFYRSSKLKNSSLHIKLF